MQTDHDTLDASRRKRMTYGLSPTKWLSLGFPSIPWLAILEPLTTLDSFSQRRSRTAAPTLTLVDPDDDGPQRQDRPSRL